MKIWDREKKVFPLAVPTVVELWNSLPQEVGMPTNLYALKRGLDKFATSHDGYVSSLPAEYQFLGLNANPGDPVALPVEINCCM